MSRYPVRRPSVSNPDRASTQMRSMRPMGDWNQDPPVIAAIREFDAARARWLRIAPADGILRTCATAEQQIAFARMQSLTVPTSGPGTEQSIAAGLCSKT
jgi:hypothetical protein